MANAIHCAQGSLLWAKVTLRSPGLVKQVGSIPAGGSCSSREWLLLIMLGQALSKEEGLDGQRQQKNT